MVLSISGSRIDMAKRGRKPNPPPIKPRPLTFFYEDFGDEIRWWANNNPGDVFDIIDKHELEIRIAAAKMLNVRVVDHLPGFCNEMEKCLDHLGYY
jgi:hypothetical protein